MKRSIMSVVGLLMATLCMAQTEVTTQEAKSLYKNTTKRRVSIHDPSVVYEPTSKRYYIFGSHKAGAYTTDMQNWTQANPTWRTAAKTNATNAEAFVTPAVTKVKKGGVEVDFPAFNAMNWSARTDANYNIDGNMWAPDVVWNPTMQKWCMYLSINGDAWHSSIVLLTADNITGPYLYQGPVVICGFYDSSHSYKDTDLELVLGTQSTLPSRYAVGNGWGRRWPHTIDPAAFYDADGKLWLVYGSWSGGIWMLELDEETGLRDYDVTYPSTNGSSDGVTSDPYFGTKVGGGYYVSGEGPYIERIGNYYYLFVSYGGFSPDGGYEMRVFRSDNPNGPYRDASNRSAIFTSYVKNFGKGSTDMRGEKIMGAYNQWGFQQVGECAQGHNSIIAAPDGRTYLVYHTKFNDGTAGHQVRTHQVFQTKNGWLVAAPFEYNGEPTTSADIATTTAGLQVSDIPGMYQILVHKYRMDYEAMEEVTPVPLMLAADGTVSGAYAGTWSVDEGTAYITLKLGTATYNGVLFDEQMDEKNIHTVSFSAMTAGGVNVWGYKMHPKYAVAWQVNNQTVPVSNNQNINKTVDLSLLASVEDNTEVGWSSSQPDIISDYGRYNPAGLEANTPVTLTARATSCDYYWTENYQVNALSEDNARSSADWTSGLLAHYGFDNETLANTLNAAEQAELLRQSTTALPTVDDGDPLRNGNVVHTRFGINGKESYVAIPNPLYGKTLTDGATISFFVKRTDNNLWDALFGLTNGNARLFMTGNAYIGFNNGSGSWFDINHPETIETGALSTGHWQLVTITFKRTATGTTGGVTIYINGSKKAAADRYNGEIDGTAKTTKAAFDYNLIVDHLTVSPMLYLGYGSFWGSADACFDDVMVYDRELTLSQVMALNQMVNRATDYSSFAPAGIATVRDDAAAPAAVYDLQGRRTVAPVKGLYIKNGRKVVVK